MDYESDGLHFTLTSNALDGQVSDDRIGYLRLKKGSVSVKPVFGGAGTILATYFTGSFATTVQLLAEEDELYTFTSEAGKYFFNERLAATGQVDDMPGNMNLQCTWSNWICLCDVAALEYSNYTPSSGSGSVGGENYGEGPNYDL